jgi:hypothetical protein
MIPPWINAKPTAFVAKRDIRVSKILAISDMGSYFTLPIRKEDSEREEPNPLVNEALGQNIDTYA